MRTLRSRLTPSGARGGSSAAHRSEVTEALPDGGQGALTPDRGFGLGLRADHTEAQALVLSGTDMRSAEIIALLQEAVRTPVIACTEATLFETLMHPGITEPVHGFGQLVEGPR